jgi:hypothetical protein
MLSASNEHAQAEHKQLVWFGFSELKSYNFKQNTHCQEGVGLWNICSSGDNVKCVKNKLVTQNSSLNRRTITPPPPCHDQKYGISSR